MHEKTEREKIEFLKSETWPIKKPILCPECNGNGYTSGQGYSWLDWTPRICAKCNGKRMLIQATWKLEHTEYEPADEVIADNKKIFKPIS